MHNEPVTHSVFQQLECAAVAAPIPAAGHRVCLSSLVRSGTETVRKRREARIKNKAFVADSLVRIRSRLEETRRPRPSRRALASICASPNANRPRLSLCLPSFLPSFLPSRRMWDFGVCAFKIFVTWTWTDGWMDNLLTNVIHSLSTLKTTCDHPDLIWNGCSVLFSVSALLMRLSCHILQMKYQYSMLPSTWFSA